MLHNDEKRARAREARSREDYQRHYLANKRKEMIRELKRNGGEFRPVDTHASRHIYCKEEVDLREVILQQVNGHTLDFSRVYKHFSNKDMWRLCEELKNGAVRKAHVRSQNRLYQGVHSNQEEPEQNSQDTCSKREGQKITSIILRNCRVFDRVGFRAIAAVLGDQLQSIDLSGSGIDEDLAETMGTYFYVLEVLKVADCPLLTDKCLNPITTGVGRTLTEMNLSGCKRLTAGAMEWIAGLVGRQSYGCYNLTTLDISNCPRY